MNPRYSSFIALAILACPVIATAAAKPADPVITFEYSNLFDNPCYATIKEPVNTAAVEEVRSRMGAWREQWERDAPAFFETTVRLTGRPFKFHEAQAALITCPPFPAMSLPLMLNVRRLLKTTQGAESDDVTAFSRLIFHEVLHRYVFDRVHELPGATTPLLDKYKSEPQPVRSHLHVLAIMEQVFNALGREDDLAADRKFMNSLGGIPGMRGAGDLKRALEIIATEHAEVLVKELSGK